MSSGMPQSMTSKQKETKQEKKIISLRKRQQFGENELIESALVSLRDKCVTFHLYTYILANEIK